MKWFTLALAIACMNAVGGPADKRLDLYFVDVEGGAATLIVTPAGESILIDTGNPGERDAKRVFTVAESLGLKQIDHLITTHYHGDHFGGAAMLSTWIAIENVHDNGEFEGGRERPAKPYLEFKAGKRSVVQVGGQLELKQAEGTPKVAIKFLAARQKFMDAPVGAKTETMKDTPRRKAVDMSDNANSIVSLLEFGGFKFLCAGDLTWNMEEKLVRPVNLVGKIDVYQVTHHGLDISNNPLVLQATEPTVAIMCNGTTKGCHEEVVKNLRATKSIQAVYQNHLCMRPDAKVKDLNTADDMIANKTADKAPCEGHHIKLSVAADAKSYTVAVPSTKHQKTYQTRK
jgi:beta-lactamase superfamily II metal-dependent hydrolase